MANFVERRQGQRRIVQNRSGIERRRADVVIPKGVIRGPERRLADRRSGLERRHILARGASAD